MITIKCKDKVAEQLLANDLKKYKNLEVSIVKLKEEIITEAPDSVEDPQIMGLVGKNFTFKGEHFKISKVKHQESFGDNYSFYIDNVEAKAHPYGGKAFRKEFDKIMPKGKEVQWSESGMQGNGYVNFDVENAKPVKKRDVKADLAKAKTILEKRGFEIVSESDEHIAGKKKGKGVVSFYFKPETEDENARYIFSKGGYGIVGGDMDYVIDYITIGRGKKHI